MTAANAGAGLQQLFRSLLFLLSSEANEILSP